MHIYKWINSMRDWIRLVSRDRELNAGRDQHPRPQVFGQRFAPGEGNIKRQRCYTNDDMQIYQLLRGEVSSLITTVRPHYYQITAATFIKSIQPDGTKKSTGASTRSSTLHSPRITLLISLKIYSMLLHLFGAMKHLPSLLKPPTVCVLILLHLPALDW